MRAYSFNKCLNIIRKGNPQGLEDIYYAYYEKIKHSAFALINDSFEAEDVASTVLKLILEKINRIPHIRYPDAWIAKISHDLAIDFIRRNAKTLIIDIDNTRFELVSGEERDTFRLMFEKCILNLTDTEQKIIIWHYIYGYKYREISRLLKKPVGTIKSYVNRIKVKLEHLKNFI